MASVYCFDPNRSYCFSLTRQIGSDEIEVMVVDQIFRRVNQLNVILSPTGLRATLDPEIASKLDGHVEYEVEFLGQNLEPHTVEEAARAVFRGKSGLSIVSDSELTFKRQAHEPDNKA
jgi:hypothetical protein